MPLTSEFWRYSSQNLLDMGTAAAPSNQTAFPTDNARTHLVLLTINYQIAGDATA